jgi:hypothetical protein
VLGHLGQRLHELLFRVINIFKSMNEKVVEVLDLHGVSPATSGFMRRLATQPGSGGSTALNGARAPWIDPGIGASALFSAAAVG